MIAIHLALRREPSVRVSEKVSVSVSVRVRVRVRVSVSDSDTPYTREGI